VVRTGGCNNNRKRRTTQIRGQSAIAFRFYRGARYKKKQHGLSDSRGPWPEFMERSRGRRAKTTLDLLSGAKASRERGGSPVVGFCIGGENLIPERKTMSFDFLGGSVTGRTGSLHRIAGVNVLAVEPGMAAVASRRRGD